MANVTFENVKKSYGDLEVIHGIDVDIRDGEFIVIVGPSGCGKSTLLRMVAGLETITQGTVTIDGKIVNGMEPKDRNIAMVFQNYALYPHMSVYANMAYGLKIAGLKKSEIDMRVKKAADMLQLEPYLERKPRALSGGQRQRVAMGRALVRDPAIFLFDEPLSNLDAKLRVQMRLEIKNMQQRVGKTALYVTHDQVEAMTLADRLIVMNNGVAEQIDTPLHVYEKPTTTFVAGFIGSPAMNIMTGLSDPQTGKFHLDCGIELKNITLPEIETHLLFGIRAEHLAITEAENADLNLAVKAVETLGADTLLHGTPRSTARPADKVGLDKKGAGDFIARVPGSIKARVGDVIPLRLDRNRVHFFDPKSQHRL